MMEEAGKPYSIGTSPPRRLHPACSKSLNVVNVMLGQESSPKGKKIMDKITKAQIPVLPFPRGRWQIIYHVGIM